ncbi:MAG TPA: hypothetical protein VMU22_15090 [Rhizomicrobium sp.]|nr:hypothetical protein [Rhizomicrobium sp.]
MFRTAKILAVTGLALATTVAAANAGCHRGTATLLGAGAGSVALGAATHSPAGWVGGAVLGGVVGHTIASENCRHEYYHHHYYRRGYYDRYGRWHRYYG